MKTDILEYLSRLYYMFTLLLQILVTVVDASKPWPGVAVNNINKYLL